MIFAFKLLGAFSSLETILEILFSWFVQFLFFFKVIFCGFLVMMN